MPDAYQSRQCIRQYIFFFSALVDLKWPFYLLSLFFLLVSVKYVRLNNNNNNNNEWEHES